MAKQNSPPLVFEEFFALGLEESISPFLTPSSRKWAHDLPLKASFLAALFLILSFATAFSPGTIGISHFFLLGVYFFAGIPSLISSLEQLTNLEINIDMMMTLAAFSSVFIGSGMEGGLLLVLFALSGAMEETVSGKAKGALSSLHKLTPTKACVIDADGTIHERSVYDVTVGTPILIKAGEVVPLDGVVLSGSSSVNLVHLTGESLPITKGPGDELPSGARNLEGALTIRVTHSSNDSTVARIIQLVTQAQEAKPKLQQFFDRLSQRYATTIILLALFFLVTLPWLFDMPYLGREGSVYRSLAFLIAASPCALILAIPIAYLSAVSSCARRGILVKGGVTLDALASCKTIAFDKTGTLTTGQLHCLGIEGEGDLREALAVAYALEQNAVHPIAKAISSYAASQKVLPAKIEAFQSVPGYGLEGRFGDKRVFIGRALYILPKVADPEALKARLTAIERRGELLTILLIGERPIFFRFEDSLRPHMKETLDGLKENYELIMLTGDHKESAERVANELQMDYLADLRPEDKLQYVGRVGIAMVGDGINDAPALTRATVGICMGKVGSAAAAEAADVVLLHDNLEKLDWLMGKAALTRRIVRQNLFIATAAIAIAALPALGGIVPLWLAVIMHEGGTVLVGLNALRLLR